MPEVQQTIVLSGAPPKVPPPRVGDFEEMDKKSIDNLIDYMKYVSTASGITMGFYAKFVSDASTASLSSLGRLLIFLPVTLWFFAVLFSVIGIFPRTYIATTDLAKEQAVKTIRRVKSFYSITSMSCFVLGFLAFSYASAAQLWKFFPYK